MTRDNVEIVAGFNAAFNRGDIKAALQRLAPDAVLCDLAGAPDQADVVAGVDAIREVWLLWSAEFDDLRAEPEEWTDVGGVVIGRALWQGRGRTSGVPIRGRRFDLYALREGKIARMTLGFGSMEEALDAASRVHEAAARE
jgi:ketosteroid isomerase-like protein